jgi:hypothetical protein
MREHRVNETHSFIAGWYHEDTSICNDLIHYFDIAEHRGPGKSYFGNERVVDLSKKHSFDCIITDINMRNRYTNYLQQFVNLYIKKYPWCNGYEPWTIVEDILIQHYPPGGAFFSWHTERGNMNVLDRHLVFMTYLNDVSDQGETEFYHQNIKVKPEKGLTLIWPADWTFTHRGIPSPSQEKYIVTGWFNFVNNN